MTLNTALAVASAVQVATKALLENKHPACKSIMVTALGVELAVVSCALRQGEVEVKVVGPAGKIVVVVGKQCGCAEQAITVCPHVSLGLGRIDRQMETTIIQALEPVLAQLSPPPALMVVIKQIEEERV